MTNNYKEIIVPYFKTLFLTPLPSKRHNGIPLEELLLLQEIFSFKKLKSLPMCIKNMEL
jgi:hypothetical protein